MCFSSGLFEIKRDHTGRVREGDMNPAVRKRLFQGVLKGDRKLTILSAH